MGGVAVTCVPATVVEVLQTRSDITPRCSVGAAPTRGLRPTMPGRRTTPERSVTRSGRRRAQRAEVTIAVRLCCSALRDAVVARFARSDPYSTPTLLLNVKLSAATHRRGLLKGRPRVRWAIREVAQEVRLVLGRVLLGERRRQQDLREDRELQLDAAVGTAKPLRLRVEEALSLARPDVVDRRARAGALEGEGDEPAEVGVAVAEQLLLRFRDADQLWLARAECAMAPWPI